MERFGNLHQVKKQINSTLMTLQIQKSQNEMHKNKIQDFAASIKRARRRARKMTHVAQTSSLSKILIISLMCNTGLSATYGMVFYHSYDDRHK